MSPSFNRCMFIGYLGQDPEMRFTPHGVAVTDFSIAVNNKMADGKEETLWIGVVAWDKLAENCNQYLKKGSLVYCEGHLRINTWKDNNDITRQKPYLRATQVVFLTHPDTLKEEREPLVDTP